MLWTLAQMDPDEALAKGYWNLAMIVLVGLLAVVFFVSMFLLRRWKHRELKAIDDRRKARRVRQAGGRIDAWAASSERYIDHDKLPEDDEAFDHGSANINDDGDSHENDDGPIPGSTAENEPDEQDHPDDEDRDPYGLFADKPYQEADDEDDFDEEDEDWNDDENNDTTQ